MKWITVFWVTLFIWVPATCFAGSGKAVMAHQYVFGSLSGTSYGATYISISNITGDDIAVRVLFRDQNGNIIQEQDGENSPATGNFKADNVTNYDEKINQTY